MNIIDMPFLASGPFPTNEVEKASGRRKKVGEKFSSEKGVRSER